MRVNSDETLRRALAFREANAGRSWLDLSRDPEQRRRSLAFFIGAYGRGIDRRSR